MHKWVPHRFLGRRRRRRGKKEEEKEEEEKEEEEKEEEEGKTNGGRLGKVKRERIFAPRGHSGNERAI